jgi:hypothetical protein
MVQTVALPTKELEPYLHRVLDLAAKAHSSITIPDVVRVADALALADGHELPVHQQTARQYLNQDNGVYRREAVHEEKLPPTPPTTKLYLYSTHHPVPAYSRKFHDQLLRDYPDPRPVPLSARTRQRRAVQMTDLAQTVLTSKKREPPLNERAELLVTLVRELVRDVDETQSDLVRSLESELATARAEVERLSMENTKLKRQMKAVERAAKLLNFAADPA